MEGEFNNLSTNNIGTTFDSKPNNIATSDELSADPIYVRKMGTAYSAGKWTKRVAVTAGFVVTMTAAAIMSGSVVKNIYVANPPTVKEAIISFSNEEYVLHYSFRVEKNSQKYPITFAVYEDGDKTPFYKVDCSTVDKYEGYVDGFEEGHLYEYKLSFTNRFDYVGTIKQGKVDTLKEVH